MAATTNIQNLKTKQKKQISMVVVRAHGILPPLHKTCVIIRVWIKVMIAQEYDSYSISSIHSTFKHFLRFLLESDSCSLNKSKPAILSFLFFFVSQIHGIFNPYQMNANQISNNLKTGKFFNFWDHHLRSLIN